MSGKVIWLNDDVAQTLLSSVSLRLMPQLHKDTNFKMTIINTNSHLLCIVQTLHELTSLTHRKISTLGTIRILPAKDVKIHSTYIGRCLSLMITCQYWIS